MSSLSFGPRLPKTFVLFRDWMLRNEATERDAVNRNVWQTFSREWWFRLCKYLADVGTGKNLSVQSMMIQLHESYIELSATGSSNELRIKLSLMQGILKPWWKMKLSIFKTDNHSLCNAFSWYCNFLFNVMGLWSSSALLDLSDGMGVPM